MTTGHGGKAPSAATGREDRIDQLAAVAAAYLERYFEGVPKPAELVKARAALDAAIALAEIPVRHRARVDPLSLEPRHASVSAG